MRANEVLDDADLQMMQGTILISDDEDHGTEMMAFSHLQPEQTEIDLEPSQSLVTKDVRDDEVHMCSPSSSPEYFEFPQADDSPPQRREKLRELWLEQDTMLKELNDGSLEVHQTDTFFPTEDDSPMTRHSKLQRIWQEDDEYIRSLTEVAKQTSSSASAACSEMTDDVHPMANDSPRTRASKLLEIWKEHDRWLDDLLQCPDVNMDPIEESEEESAPVRKERPVKYGRCPEHRLPLYPHLHSSPQARAWGCIYLRCQNFKERNAAGKPSCWFSRQLTEEEMKVLPKALVVAQKKIRADVSWQLRNGSAV